MLSTLTLASFLERAVSQYSDMPAVTLVGGLPLNYKELGVHVSELSAKLRENGVTQGDRVAILSENKPNWVVAFFAITTMGAVAVPILPDFQPEQVRHILRHSESKALFISNRQFEKIQQDEPVTVKDVYLIETLNTINPDTPQDRIKSLLKERGRDLQKIKNAAMKFAGFKGLKIDENDLASIIYTSGTTGHSKGVMLSHKNLISNAIAANKVHEITTKDRSLSILPLSHTYECTVGMLVILYGGGMINYIEKPPTPRVLMEAMQQVRPTIMLSVPLVIEKVYKNRVLAQFNKSAILKRLYQKSVFRKKLHKLAGKKLYKSFGGKLEFFGIGGAKLSTDVEIFLKDAGFPYAIGYGLTETSPILAGAGPSYTRIGSTGPAVQGVDIRIDSPDPYSIEGEVQAKGPNVMKGYYRDPELTKQQFTPDGWFRTGDLGILDKDNFLYIKGRLKNVIVGPSGENIYPEEIETIINQCDYVMESLVYNDHGKLAARIHLNYDTIDQDFNAESELEMRKKIQDLLVRIQKTVNSRVTVFSRINKLVEQTEPFEKTPTQKIKRYLYIS